jgi:hypothetical protein
VPHCTTLPMSPIEDIANGTRPAAEARGQFDFGTYSIP